MGETLAFSADDGAVAPGGRYHTLQGEARAAVLIAGAMGAQGYAALGFDHRAMGESLPASVSSGASSNPR
jgi:alpha-beta hydrolase superfamily lysophospholipase